MTFEDFWIQYDKKTGRKRCLAKWKLLKETEKDVIAWTLASYIQSTPDKIYRKHPITYLNGECWNDEIIKPKEDVNIFSEESIRNRLSKW